MDGFLQQILSYSVQQSWESVYIVEGDAIFNPVLENHSSLIRVTNKEMTKGEEIHRSCSTLFIPLLTLLQEVKAVPDPYFSPVPCFLGMWEVHSVFY